MRTDLVMAQNEGGMSVAAVRLVGQSMSQAAAGTELQYVS